MDHSDKNKWLELENVCVSNSDVLKSVVSNILPLSDIRSLSFTSAILTYPDHFKLYFCTLDMSLNEDEQHAVLIENAIGVDIRGGGAQDFEENEESKKIGLDFDDLQKEFD